MCTRGRAENYRRHNPKQMGSKPARENAAHDLLPYFVVNYFTAEPSKKQACTTYHTGVPLNSGDRFGDQFILRECAFVRGGAETRSSLILFTLNDISALRIWVQHRAKLRQISLGNCCSIHLSYGATVSIVAAVSGNCWALPDPALSGRGHLSYGATCKYCRISCSRRMWMFPGSHATRIQPICRNWPFLRRWGRWLTSSGFISARWILEQDLIWKKTLPCTARDLNAGAGAPDGRNHKSRVSARPGDDCNRQVPVGRPCVSACSSRTITP